MDKWKWKKKLALAEQLEFFGAKKKGFVSVYAKKPRILCKVKLPVANSDRLTREPIQFNDKKRQMAALYQQQRQLGMQSAFVGYDQLAAVHMAQDGQGQPLGLAGTNIHSQLFGGIFK